MKEPLVDLDEVARICYSAVFSDVCDHLHARNVTMGPQIRHLAGPPGTLVGWARTVTSAGVESAPERHYGREIDFIDSLGVGDVVVATVDTPAAFWGELFSAAALGRGARGVVVDGLIRDSVRIDELGFATYGVGHRPTDSLGRISIQATDTPIVCGGVDVRSGDLVVADADGVAVVPAELANKAVRAAMEKAQTEAQAKDLLRSGALLRDAWERFGVL